MSTDSINSIINCVVVPNSVISAPCLGLLMTDPSAGPTWRQEPEPRGCQTYSTEELFQARPRYSKEFFLVPMAKSTPYILLVIHRISELVGALEMLKSNSVGERK